jgi:hypothetical protein
VLVLVRGAAAVVLVQVQVMRALVQVPVAAVTAAPPLRERAGRPRHRLAHAHVAPRHAQLRSVAPVGRVLQLQPGDALRVARGPAGFRNFVLSCIGREERLNDGSDLRAGAIRIKWFT